MVTDNQPLFRKGLKRMLDLQPDIRVVGEARDGREAYHLVEQYQPDVVLMVVRVPVKECIETSRAIRERFKKVKIVFLFAFDEAEFLPEGFEVGAIGFPLRDPTSHQITGILRAAVKSEHPRISYYDAKDRVASEDTPGRVKRAAANTFLNDPLIQHEFEVLKQICAGKDNPEIAASLHLTVGTVKNYVSNVYKKLGVRNRREAITKARELGLC